MLSAGHLLDNRYRLDDRIATGGMGDVWRGTDVVLGRVVAVKVLRTAMLADPEFSARFYGEARMMAAFRHPGVVEVYDYASATDSTDDSQCAYLVMAYVEGEPLSARLKRAGHLGVTETMSIVAQAADALHAAHENGTVHRDVKPGNLIVKPNGTVILVDFGVARSAAVTSVTGLNAIVGTALYMAPEQVAKGNVSPATDIYALGAVAYHCLAGRPPFDGDNALQVALRHLDDEPDPLPDDVPPAVRDLISRAMAKDPADRFDSSAEFADAAMQASGTLDRSTNTGTALVIPMQATTQSRVASTATTHTVPVAAPVGPPPRRRPPSSQLVVLCTVLGLVVAAIGTVVAIAVSAGQETGNGQPPVPPPTSAAAPSVEPTTSEEPAPTTRTSPTFRVPAQPVPTTPRTSTAPTTKPTPSPTRTSSSPSPTPTTTTPPTTPPTTAPTTAPTPSATPSATPTATPTATDGGEAGEVAIGGPDGGGPGKGAPGQGEPGAG